MGLEAYTFDWYSVTLEFLNQVVESGTLGVDTFDVVVVDVQFGAGVGGFGSLEGGGYETFSHGFLPDGASQLSVLFEDLVDYVPGVDASFPVTHNVGDVVLHDSLQLAGGDVVHPSGNLAVPYQGVTTDFHAVRFGEGHQFVTGGVAECVLAWFGGVDFHFIFGGQHVEVGDGQGLVGGIAV